MYHDIVEPGHPDASGRVGPGAARYKVDTAEFIKHLRAIAEVRRASPVLVTALAAGATQGAVPLLLTFDDGGSSACHAADFLEHHGWRGHFFITTNDIGGRTFLNRSQIRDLRSRGHVVGSHTSSHPERMSHLGSDEMLEEWRRSADVLSDLLGERVTTGSVPGGFYSIGVARAAAKAGISVLFTSEPTTRCSAVDGCSVVGRYAVCREVPAEVVARLALARPVPRARQYVAWSLKKAGKLVGGSYYVKLRRLASS